MWNIVNAIKYAVSIRSPAKKVIARRVIRHIGQSSEPFALRQWIYRDDSYYDSAHPRGMYDHEHRMSRERENYAVWNKATLDKIQKALIDNTPLHREEQKSFEETKATLTWIHESLAVNPDAHVVGEVSH